MSQEDRADDRAAYWTQRYETQGVRTVGHSNFTLGEFDAQTTAARALLREFATPYFIGKRVLDFGCGWGRMIPVLLEMGCTVTGVDFVRWAIARAQSLWPRAGFHYLTQSRLPFSDAYFDGVLSWTVLQHVPPDRLSSVCAELVRVVQPARGWIIVYENCTAAPDKPHVWFRQPDRYENFFRGMRLKEHRIIEDLDGTGEKHAIMALQAFPC